jgi:ATP-binding cassette subfamily B (MDR/TAP) protein 1
MDYGMFVIVIICSFASGAGIALQNLIFGSFVTHITGFASGASTPAEFRAAASKLA